VNLDKALLDPNLLGAALGNPKSWATWLATARAAFALPMSKRDCETFDKIAGGRTPPKRRVKELWVLAGRRSGKTRVASAISTYIACIAQHKLSRGEIGYVLVLSASKAQSQVAYQYILGFLEASKILRQQVISVGAEEIKLRGNIVIGVHSNNYRTVRGRSLLAVIADETSFWRDELSATPDVETHRACMPALAASGGLWVSISTGYRKAGLMYEKWRQHYAQSSDDVLVVQGSTLDFNPSIPSSVVEQAKESDPEGSEAEWQGGFRNDISSFLDDATIERAIAHGRPLELPPLPQHRYSAFLDPSGGRHDAMTLCIGHKDKQNWIADVIRGKQPPFNPEAVVEEFVELLHDYGIKQVISDGYSGAWAETAFTKRGIKFVRSELNKSQIYLESLPLFMRDVVRLPNHPKMMRELRLLERRVSRSGQDVCDHGHSGSDDYINSVCGALVNAVSRKGPIVITESMRNWAMKPYLRGTRRSRDPVAVAWPK
jgi:hypothetical protein